MKPQISILWRHQTLLSIKSYNFDHFSRISSGIQMDSGQMFVQLMTNISSLF